MSTKRGTKRATPATVTSRHSADSTLITPVNPEDSEAIARLLLDAAADASQIRTVTSPAGWIAPTTIVKKAGLV